MAGGAEYVRLDKPGADARLLKTIQEAADGLLEFPSSGKAGRMPGTRELVVSGTVYILVYRVRGNTVVILRVMHSKRFFPPIA